MSDFEQSLISLEKLDRSSPELWPEAIPGVTEYAARNSLTVNYTPKAIADALSNFDSEDYKLLNFPDITKYAYEKELDQSVSDKRTILDKLAKFDAADYARLRRYSQLPRPELMAEIKKLMDFDYWLTQEFNRQLKTGRLLLPLSGFDLDETKRSRYFRTRDSF